MSREHALSLLQPLARRISQLDLNDAASAANTLNTALPIGSLDEVYQALKVGQAEGWLTPKQATPTLKFGRLCRSGPAMFGHSVDVVDMAGAGAAHTHPNGEVSLCWAEEGQPNFCGEPAGWVVVPPGSRHVPDVTGGRMLIVYFLPDGAMTWG
jgi:hypothetical protein